ncbi:MAG: N-acetyltransferase [Chitinophagaceae bacterium]|nr:MAG: N-acetyltransferase [Chitinophagaceae bacterium]
MTQISFAPFPVLTTKRLILRQPEAGDAQEVFALRSDGEINRYLGRQPAASTDDAMNFIKAVNENTEANASLYWAITFRDSNKLIGTICLFGFSGEYDRCEIGYELSTGFQGQGIMKEALEKVIDYAFRTLGVGRIEGSVHKDNESSIRLLEKLSFRDAGEPDAAVPELVNYYLLRADGKA